MTKGKAIKRERKESDSELILLHMYAKIRMQHKEEETCNLLQSTVIKHVISNLQDGTRNVSLCIIAFSLPNSSLVHCQQNLTTTTATTATTATTIPEAYPILGSVFSINAIIHRRIQSISLKLLLILNSLNASSQFSHMLPKLKPHFMISKTYFSVLPLTISAQSPLVMILNIWFLLSPKQRSPRPLASG
ncbi:PREDICTED: uncharacterized protein LOC109344767 [Lupinus angustifolius]|uniref:uncharacterized protein LOC109344767 n=1 Tax=Lupinus angustifolius TaxID=3871 RepID=UPI00092E3EF3|nr:PREDICTED: uncharacterized protein LOC109344767 [Lupinus angustifolius]